MRERCIWVTAEPLDAASAKAELQNAGMDVAAAVREGSLVVRDYADWYAEAGSLKGNAVVDLWLAEESRALAQGYSGLRIDVVRRRHCTLEHPDHGWQFLTPPARGG